MWPQFICYSTRSIVGTRVRDFTPRTECHPAAWCIVVRSTSGDQSVGREKIQSLQPALIKTVENVLLGTTHGTRARGAVIVLTVADVRRIAGVWT